MIIGVDLELIILNTLKKKFHIDMNYVYIYFFPFKLICKVNVFHIFNKVCIC